MAKISACVISFNEEAKIAGCLESLAGVADEIVVVDSGSTDRTREIAGELADLIVTQPFLGYVEQKNFAKDRASHDWVLSLDCDERLSDQLRSEILALKEQPGAMGQHAAYSMPRRTHYVDAWVNHSWYPDRRVRLFHRQQARWGGHNPHDSVQVDGGTVTALEGDILHYSIDSVSHHLQTIDRFSEIGAQALYEAGARATVFTPVIRGTARFLKIYVLKRGFMDGFGGLTLSVLSGTAAFTRYAKLLYLQRAEARADPPSPDS